MTPPRRKASEDEPDFTLHVTGPEFAQVYPIRYDAVTPRMVSKLRAASGFPWPFWVRMIFDKEEFGSDLFPSVAVMSLWQRGLLGSWDELADTFRVDGWKYHFDFGGEDEGPADVEDPDADPNG